MNPVKSKTIAKYSISIFLGFMLLLPVLLSAQEPTPKIDVKQTRDYVIHHERWQWLVGEGAILVGTGVAFYGSSYGQDHGGTEQGLALGSHPSHARLVGVGFAAAGTYSALYYVNYRYYRDSASSKQRLFAKITLPIAMGILNGYYAHHDLTLNYGHVRH